MKRLSVFFISILVSYVFMAMPVYAQDFNYPFNNTMTTDCGPAFADILLEQSNFLPCKGGPIALCYYSGPEPETCVVVQEEVILLIASVSRFPMAYILLISTPY